MKLSLLGGGQLGQMTTLAAIPLGAQVHMLDPSENAPCRVFTGFQTGDVTDATAIADFIAQQPDAALTYEWEQVSISGLRAAEQAGVRVCPSADVLAVIQDKGRQKQFFVEHNVPTAGFTLWDGVSALSADSTFPLVQKARTGGYDGKGVQIVQTAAELWPVPSVLEQLVDLETELAVTVARAEDGHMEVYTPVQMQFDPVANLVTSLIAPAQVSEVVAKQAQQIAQDLAKKLQLVGVLSVEFFVDASGMLLVNEMAPRPHNSAHHTIEACVCSQFENHARAVLNLPLGSAAMTVGAAGMVNIIGQHIRVADVRRYAALLALDGVHLHWYGKIDEKPDRKLGHVSITGTSVTQVQRRISVVQKALTQVA